MKLIRIPQILTIYLVVFIGAIVIGLCYWRFKPQPAERNRIQFRNDFSTVRDSILKITNILDNLKGLKSEFSYHFNERKFFMNDVFVGDLDSLLLHNDMSLFTHLNNSENHKFISLAKYLNSNFIESGYWDQETKLWRFSYRYIAPGLHENTREITIKPIGSFANIEKGSRILEERENLLLMAPVDVHIKQ